MKQLVIYALSLLTLLFIPACSHQPATRLTSGMVDASALPASTPGLDHYIAWVPAEAAQTASVAEALVHISLQQARERVSEEMCEGQAIARGIVAEKHGPVAVRNPASMGATPAWYYRISQRPGLQGCGAESANNLQRAIQSSLPAWISVTPGKPGISHAAAIETSH